MALWQPGQKLYLPPTPVTKVVCTESYVTRKDIFYHGETERLLTVGHPYYSLKIGGKDIPKVSPNQFRVFKVQLPDPNQFALPDRTIHNPTKERLVWGLVGLQVSRGQPLNPPITGHPLLNVYADAETMYRNRPAAPGKDDRKQAGLGAKQNQVLMVGCTPATGEYWDKAEACQPDARPQGSCPPIELKNKVIEDGDMMEIGFGAANFQNLNVSKSDVPLDIGDSICVYPDYLKMAEETSGNSLFFYARKEQVYTRHIYARGGQESNEKPPDNLILKRSQDVAVNNSYMGCPSGSLVSTDGQLFNRPYWLFMAQGMNNGIAWNNTLYVTVGDNTRGGNIVISVTSDGQKQEEYDATKLNVYHRHVEEYKLAFVLQLCAVALTPESVAYLQTSFPLVLENWEIGLQPPVSSALEDQYRYIDSAATKCPDQVKPPEPKDPYADKNFWVVNLKDKLSLDLDQFPLGRRFLSQRGVGCKANTLKRKPVTTSTTSGKRKKRSR
ncbi:L1 [Camelus dromedarius papillomavirus 2]|uniref:Major capsid protein L1 n=1 Tax=Camelus dromedarius papillomavirus 2 TaxID=996651 RepID=F2YGI1_9PAPI|nr:L1 [Camelus dromedarius papillomavirus 2]ADZ53062.1 L1 [Camelus dromedarius papillomavirus 2]